MRRTYLDYNATAPIRPGVQAAVAEALSYVGNASSIHSEGRHAHGLIEQAREKVAALVNTDPSRVIFTSGGTEANVTCLAPQNVISIAGGDHKEEEIRCFVSAIEHPSVIRGGRFPAASVRPLPVDGDGVIDRNALVGILEAHCTETGGTPFLVSLMLANNETGVVEPVSEIAALVHEYGGVIHSDCVQAAGKIPIDITVLGVDYLTLSAHKIGGPQGAGALILGHGDRPLGAPLLTGGSQELKRRAGTENVAALAGFGVAAEQAAREVQATNEVRRLRDQLESELSQNAPEIVIFSQAQPRLPNTSMLSLRGLTAEMLVIALDLAGFAVSSGSACSSGKVETSHVLAAMGVDKELADSAIRISIGRETREQDIERFITAWSEIYMRFKARQDAA